ncbi:hypothetical protein ACQVP2_08675 [Methylobacterium aquaticum]|uniref:hypothetical protein n=1 Tax=Methylobacterium aquaticum TaxID=270351 RepID=UPI003D174A2A
MRAARWDRGASRLKPGDLVGVSDHRIMKCELGQDHVGAGLLWKICSILQCPFDSLLGSAQAGRVVAVVEPAPDDAPLPGGQAILAAFRSITPPVVRSGWRA